MISQSFLRLSGSRPPNFHGVVKLPPSKSYLHRALFVSALCKTPSTIENAPSASSYLSEDIRATINILKLFGVRFKSARKSQKNDLLLVTPPSNFKTSTKEIFARGSGTTARFAIAFSSIFSDGGKSIITGNESLLNRPMQPLLDSLSQIGVRCYSKNCDGKLPVVVEASGISGGKCVVDGSISSQFVSALLIACTQARNDTTIVIDDFSKIVSFPYIVSTQFVLKFFGFDVRQEEYRNSLRFHVKGNQTNAKGKKFRVPGDMSSCAAIMGATMAARGSVRLNGVDLKMPQADSSFLKVAKEFGAKVSQRGDSLMISASKGIGRINRTSPLNFDLKNSPDIAPIVAGVAASDDQDVIIRNVGHLRFKESDRLITLASELRKIGVQALVSEDYNSLSIFSTETKKKNGKEKKGGNYETILNSRDDHRILMALAIAGLSGRFGEILISNPSCVKKSYPSFIDELKSLANRKREEERIVSIVRIKSK